MERNESLCEKLEIAFFSGEELTDELNNHAKTCEHCRKFLEQSKALEQDLKKLNITGFEEGKLADAVMAKVREQNKKPSIKFNLTHHMGTAAALVIICAVALYVKHIPSDMGDKPVKYAEDSVITEEAATVDGADRVIDARIIPLQEEADNSEDYDEYGVSLTGADEDFDDAAEADGAYTDEAAPVYDYRTESYDTDRTMSFITADSETEESTVEESAEAEESSPEASGTALMFKSPIPESKSEDNWNVPTEEPKKSPEEQYAKDDITSDDTEVSNDSSDSGAINDAIGEAIPQEEKPSSGSGSSGGGGGSSGGSGGSSSSANSKEKTVADSDKYSDGYLVFEGIEFLRGEENLDKNVALANSRLAQLYGSGFYVIDADCLINNGWGGNEFFFESAPSMTYSFIISLEGSPRTITGK